MSEIAMLHQSSRTSVLRGDRMPIQADENNGVCSSPSATSKRPSNLSSFNRIRAKITIDSLPNLTGTQIAGRYTNPSKELIKETGLPLAGEKLYIFPDNSYIYCKWADVMLDTVFDKGVRRLDGGILELKSDPEIVWDPELEREFVAVRRPSHKDEILLMGLKKSLPYFEKHPGDEPELT
jgi:hypothetical protein